MQRTSKVPWPLIQGLMVWGPCWLQIMAACRCKRSKMHFLLTTIFGKRWREHELFVPEEQVAPEAQDVLREYLAARSVSFSCPSLLPQSTC